MNNKNHPNLATMPTLKIRPTRRTFKSQTPRPKSSAMFESLEDRALFSVAR